LWLARSGVHERQEVLRDVEGLVCSVVLNMTETVPVMLKSVPAPGCRCCRRADGQVAGERRGCGRAKAGRDNDQTGGLAVRELRVASTERQLAVA